MIGVRTVNSIAAVINGLALGATALARPGIAAALLALSSLLLIWSLEKVRVHIARETRS